ncbi:MAG: YdeI/OmpD-associated family protein [Bacteroidetes bacterium]|nr:YdeI/OmpD-associated family protein [Bacteroidota bacterium]
MKVLFTVTIQRFKDKGEKTGWTYIDVPADVAQRLKPGFKKSFRVKGKLDGFSIKGIALIPMGGGDYIMPLNAGLRKGIGKRAGAMLKVNIEADDSPVLLDADLVECLDDDPDASDFFKSLSKSHQNYFSKWIASAKTEETKAKRIAHAVQALSRKLNFAEMLRSLKKSNIS